MKKVVLDTNLYVGWLNAGLHEDLILGPGFVRYLSGVVYMELAAGAQTTAARRALAQLRAGYERGDRFVLPSVNLYERAGYLLPKLRRSGHDVRRASFVNDVLIALSARSLGATVFTADADFEAIRAVEDFAMERA